MWTGNVPRGAVDRRGLPLEEDEGYLTREGSRRCWGMRLSGRETVRKVRNPYRQERL